MDDVVSYYTMKCRDLQGKASHCREKAHLGGEHGRRGGKRGILGPKTGQNGKDDGHGTDDPWVLCPQSQRADAPWEPLYGAGGLAVGTFGRRDAGAADGGPGPGPLPPGICRDSGGGPALAGAGLGRGLRHGAGHTAPISRASGRNTTPRVSGVWRRGGWSIPVSVPGRSGWPPRPPIGPTAGRSTGAAAAP